MELPELAPNSNKFDVFKRRFPLAVTHVDHYFKKINELQGDEFTPEQMAAKFTTKAWTEPEIIDGKRGHSSQLTDGGSMFRKFIATLPNCTDEKLSKLSILCLGLVWCQGSIKAKAA